MAQTYFNDDTIAAIATAPHAVSAVGIVRISGANAWPAAQAVLRPIPGALPDWKKAESHKLYRCLVVDEAGAALDDALFVRMRAPHSYTGEEVVELHMHGNPRLLQRALGVIVGGGKARQALPGEFSYRAFQNGRLDLSQAEAVMDLIASASPAAAKHAVQGLLGQTKKFVDESKRSLTRLLAELEVEIDFSDQGVGSLDYAAWARRAGEWEREVEAARADYLRRTPLREGIRLALVGRPNSGKSTLFNALLGEERSIVSDVAGTTRDVVRESFLLGGALLVLADTAGIRNSGDAVEAIGIERSFGELRAAQLVLAVVDAAVGETEAMVAGAKELLAQIRATNPDARVVFALNKQDLLSTAEAKERLAAAAAALGSGVVGLSAKTKAGRRELEEAILAAFPAEAEGAGAHIGRLRHYELLGRAAISVREAVALVGEGKNLPDLLANHLRAALSNLGEITGEVGADDVLNYIFSEFCIGK